MELLNDIAKMDATAEVAKRIKENVALAVSIASRYKNKGTDFETLVAAAVSGLWQAAEGFDPDRGAFSTYAVHKIRKEIWAAIGLRRTVWIPRYIRETMLPAWNRATAFLAKQLGRNPSKEEVQEKAGLSDDDAEKVIHALVSIQSIVIHSEEGDAELNLPGRESFPDDDAMQTDDAEHLYDAIENCLTPVEQKIIRGVLRGQTFQSIADGLGIASRQRVCQLRDGAMAKLRFAIRE
jgi:RNA polymerase sigma factor (sigma-70 family)